MTRTITFAASLAVLCLATEPLLADGSAPKQRILVAQLCGGGETTIPLGRESDDQPHCPRGKACHAANCRKQFDAAQRQRGR